MFLASFVACWHCAFEAQPGMNFLALASTVVTLHNHTVRIARNLSRRRCKYVQMVSSLGFLAPGISGSWSNYVQHALCWPNIIKHPCCQGQPFCSSHGKTVHLATAPGKPGTWLNLKKIKWRDSHMAGLPWPGAGHRIAKILCLEPILKGGQKTTPRHHQV